MILCSACWTVLKRFSLVWKLYQRYFKGRFCCTNLGGGSYLDQSFGARDSVVVSLMSTLRLACTRFHWMNSHRYYLHLGITNALGTN
jgi:hypothetical protein